MIHASTIFQIAILQDATRRGASIVAQRIAKNTKKRRGKMAELMQKCPFCKKKYLFGTRCDCLDTAYRIERLHRKTMELLDPKKVRPGKTAKIFVIEDGKERLYCECSDETKEDRNYIECMAQSLRDMLGVETRIERR